MNKYKQLLLVDAGAGQAAMLSTYFQAQGYDVFTATSGESALVLADQGLPDLVLLDFKLPGISGYETCLRLRTLPEAQQVPVLFLAERQESPKAFAELELGPVEYVTKPLDIHELSLRVRSHLAHSDQSSGQHPITGFPAGAAVRERLEQMLGGPEWAVVVAGISGLRLFREKYGFIAAEEVIHAAGLLIASAVSASGAAEAFIGHLDPADFAIITGLEQQERLAQHCLVRLRLAIPHFYPSGDWARLQDEDSERLRAHAAHFSSSKGGPATLEELTRTMAAAV